MVDDGIDIIRTAEKYYRSKDTVAKQRIVSSIYPNKLVFDKTGYRTPENLKFVNLLCRVDKAFKGNKKGKKTEISVSSLEVDFTDKISNQLLKDIETLSSLKRYISSH